MTDKLHLQTRIYLLHTNDVFLQETEFYILVKLPTPTTGFRVTVLPSTTVGVKVYPNAAGQSIGTGTTATTAVVVAANKATQFIATSATKWRVLASA